MKTNKRIFIVDDDQFWTGLLTQMLSDLGYTNIVTFSNGTDCINNLHLNPAMVFLDYQMEDVDGLEVLQKIKEYYPRIGVVFCTAHEDLSVAVDAMKYGSFDYLLKENANMREVKSSSNEPAALYDLTKLKAIAKGNESFVQKMVNLFIEQAPASVNEINEAFHAGDFTKVKKIAHRLKPSVDSMGIIALKDEIRQIELLAEQDAASPVLKGLITKLDTVISAVMKELKMNFIKA